MTSLLNLNLQNKKVHVHIMLATNENKVVEYYGRFDKMFNGLDIMDDFVSERAEVAKHNSWFRYSWDVHVARCAGTGENTWPDLLDEAAEFSRQGMPGSSMTPYEVFMFITQGFGPTARVWNDTHGVASNTNENNHIQENTQGESWRTHIDEVQNLIMNHTQYFDVKQVKLILNYRPPAPPTPVPTCQICYDLPGNYVYACAHQGGCSGRYCKVCADRVFKGRTGATCPNCRRRIPQPAQRI